MKLIAGLVLLWFLCGVIAAGLIQETRPATAADIGKGPISLVNVLRG
jgi:hypothetical protein